MVDDIAVTDDDRAFLADPEKMGGACIVGPSGTVLAGPMPGGTEGIIYADVDLDACLRSRLVIDMGGHYNRSDVYQLAVNNTPRPLVAVTIDAPGATQATANSTETDE